MRGLKKRALPEEYVIGNTRMGRSKKSGTIRGAIKKKPFSQKAFIRFPGERFFAFILCQRFGRRHRRDPGRYRRFHSDSGPDVHSRSVRPDDIPGNVRYLPEQR